MISLLLVILCATNIYGEETVKFAAVIFRHGDRTPVAPYPNDPWKNESLWPVKFGQLTNMGKLQHFAFGKWLRDRYSHLVAKYFDPAEVYVRSTDVDRTLMSAQANLAGLYPPIGSSIWNANLLWQPIPVHTVPESDDELLAMAKDCPAYTKEYDKYITSIPYKKKLTPYLNMMEYLSKQSGMTIKSFDELMNLYSTLYIENLYKFALPKWASMFFPKMMQEPACYSFTIPTATPFLARLKAGPILKHIYTHLAEAVTDTTGKHRKLLIYSGHDITVGNVLHAMGLYDGNCPCYTSAVFFELIMDNSTSTHYVKVSYRNSTGNIEPIVLDIPTCGKLCPVEKFAEVYDNLLTVNWDWECSRWFSPIFVSAFFIGMFLVFSIYAMHKIHFSRIYQQQSYDAYVNIVATSVTPLKLAVPCDG